MPVTVVKPGDDAKPHGTIIVKEINPLDKFTMGLKQMAEHCGLSMNKTKAMVLEFGIPDDPEAFREFRIGSQSHKRYSKRALDVLRLNLDQAAAIWEKRRHQLGRTLSKPR